MNVNRPRPQRLRYLPVFLCSLVLGSILWLTGQADGQIHQSEQVEVTQVLPHTTALVVSVERPAELVDHFLNHPLRDDIEQLDAFQSAMSSPQALQGKLMLGLFESQIGMTWPEAIKSATHHGIYLAGDPEHEGFALLLHADSETNLRKIAGTMLNWVTKQAEDEGRASPFQIREYRDFKVADFGNAVMARWKSWLLISNRKSYAKQIADNFMDRPASSLASAPWYRAALKLETPGDLRAAVDVKTLREKGIAAELFRGEADNPAIELILGGLLDVLEDAEVAAARLNLGDPIEFSVSLPASDQKIRSVREYYFGPSLGGRAPTPIQPDGWIANLTSYRDLAGWWLSKEELFEERVIAELAQADSQLSTIFGGLDFGEEVLGSIQPGVQIVVAEQSFEGLNGAPQPDVKLPSFGLIARLYEPEQVRSRFKIAFQSLIGFINIELGQQGQPQLELDSDRVGSAFLTTARYLMDQPDDYRSLVANFSPTIAFQDDYFIVSSTRQLADQILKEVKERDEATLDSNTLLSINGHSLKRILEQNQESLIAQNMLEQGNDRKTARDHVDIILQLLEWVDSGMVDFKAADGRLKLSAVLEFKTDE